MRGYFVITTIVLSIPMPLFRSHLISPLLYPLSVSFPLSLALFHSFFQVWGCRFRPLLNTVFLTWLYTVDRRVGGRGGGFDKIFKWRNRRHPFLCPNPHTQPATTSSRNACYICVRVFLIHFTLAGNVSTSCCCCPTPVGWTPSRIQLVFLLEGGCFIAVAICV